MTMFKTTAAATVLALTTAMPAFAAAHADLSTLTCGEYNAMSAEDQNAIAIKAVMEMNQAAEGSLETSTGTLRAADVGGDANAEQNAAATANADSTAVTTEGVRTADVGGSVDTANPDQSDMAAQIALLNTTCASSVGATVMEAAVGDDGTS